MAKRGWILRSVAVTVAEAALVRIGRTYGSTKEERARELPGDDIVGDPKVVTDHGLESADKIGRPTLAEVLEHGCGETGAIALVAHDHDHISHPVISRM